MAPTPLLRPSPVRLEELGFVLEGDVDSGGLMDLRTGDVWSHSAIEYALDSGEEDEERFAGSSRSWNPRRTT